MDPHQTASEPSPMEYFDLIPYCIVSVKMLQKISAGGIFKYVYGLTMVDLVLLSKKFFMYGRVHEISILSASARNEGSDVSAHMRTLVRAFAARIHEVWMKAQTKI